MSHSLILGRVAQREFDEAASWYEEQRPGAGLRRGRRRRLQGGAGGADLWMVKIKTDAYLQHLKQAFADRWEDY